MPTLSFLIPSRDNFERLLKMVRSIRAHPESDELEIRVWFDDDDLTSITLAKNLSPYNVIIHTGPRLKGYGSLGEFCTIMANASECPWVCVANDDNVFKGKKFIQDLQSQPTTGIYCTTEIYQLNASRYTDFYQFAFIPNGSWKIETPVIPEPADYWLHQTLVIKHGWKIHRLAGTTMVHEWTPR
jgi:hypothetical protein